MPITRYNRHALALLASLSQAWANVQEFVFNDQIEPHIRLRGIRFRASAVRAMLRRFSRKHFTLSEIITNTNKDV